MVVVFSGSVGPYESVERSIADVHVQTVQRVKFSKCLFKFLISSIILSFPRTVSIGSVTQL